MALRSRGALALGLILMLGASASTQDQGAPPGGPETPRVRPGGPPGRDMQMPPGGDGAQIRQQWRELTKEQREAIVAVIGDLRPLTPEERRRLLAMDINRFRNLVQEHAGQIMELARLRQAQPELYRFKIDDVRLVRQGEETARRIAEARHAGRTEAVASLEGELRGLVEKQVDLRYEMRAFEIQALERRLAELRSQLEGDRARRESLIDRRLEELRALPGRGLRPPPERRGGG